MLGFNLLCGAGGEASTEVMALRWETGSLTTTARRHDEKAKIQYLSVPVRRDVVSSWFDGFSMSGDGVLEIYDSLDSHTRRPKRLR
jgi:hypothetical protein